MTLYAHWRQARQTVTFDANDNGAGATLKHETAKFDQGGTYAGAVFSVSGAEWEGHTFLGWFTEAVDGEPVKAGDTVTSEATRTLYAHWQQDRQTVKFCANGEGAVPSQNSAKYVIGASYSGKVFGSAGATWTGHTFLGWYDDPSAGTRVKAGDTVTSEATRKLYAHWRQNRQTVTFDANDGGAGAVVAKPTAKYDIGGNYSMFETPTWGERVFLGWFDAPVYGTRVKVGDVVTQDSERKLYAHWLQTVKFDKNADDAECRKDQTSCVIGETYSGFVTPTRERYDFVGWFDAPEGGTRLTHDTTVTPDSERTLYAHWRAARQTVHFNANGDEGATCSRAEKLYAMDGNYSPIMTASWEGHKFLGWFDAPEGGNRVLKTDAVTTDPERTLYAHWEATAAPLSISGFSRSARAGFAPRGAKSATVEYTLWVETGGEWTVLKRWTADEDGETEVSVSVPAGAVSGFFRVVLPDGEE